MKQKCRYLLGMIAVSIGCAVLYFQYSISIGLLLITTASIITHKLRWTKPYEFKKAKFKPKVFFKGLSLLCVLPVFLVLYFSLSPEEQKLLFGKWYFTGPVWLLIISALLAEYFEEQEKAQQGNTADA